VELVERCLRAINKAVTADMTAEASMDHQVASVVSMAGTSPTETAVADLLQVVATAVVEMEAAETTTKDRMVMDSLDFADRASGVELITATSTALSIQWNLL
jgi:hypothetical protein